LFFCLNVEKPVYYWVLERLLFFLAQDPLLPNQMNKSPETGVFALFLPN
jgi:hypothetical protein